MFWEKDIETLDRSQLEKYQIRLLKQAVDHAFNCRFYKKIFSEQNINSDSITSLDDLKRIPFTVKQDLRNEFPDGFMAADKSLIVRLHSSSGTTGQSTVIYHTQRDLNVWTNLVARSLYMAGFRNTDVFQNMMGYGLFTGGLGLHYGAERMGMLVIPASSGNSHRQIELIKNYNVTAAHIIPSYAFYLFTYFQQLNVDPKKDTMLKKFVLGAEPHTEEMRKKI
ncbi:MAG TPA: phenylacetate--CoA ligase, partial [bacterium]|nr:phenylacetate--CoA ligase [bacterium]